MSKIRYGSLGLTETFEQLNVVDSTVRQLKHSLASVQMIEAFGGIALEHHFSAPVVAVMLATPGFTQTVQNFPESDLFNIVPEHKSSPRQAMGLESLSLAQGTAVEGIRHSAQAIATTFGVALESLESTVEDLQARIDDAKLALTSAEFPDEVVGDMVLSTLSAAGYSQLFQVIDDQLAGVEAFDATQLQANPEQLADTVSGLGEIVASAGPALGFDLDQTGLVDAPKSHDYIPTMGSVESKGLDKLTLEFYLARADSVLAELRGISARRDELVQGLQQGAEEIPAVLEGSDVVYGAADHVTLMGCYTTLTNKLVRESMLLTSRLLTVTDEIVSAGNGDVE